ncbi:similar to anagen-specific protein mKAP13 (predicted) [Rattus norvegicus]|uniref:Keratin-associated protein n=2 Tax=Rattus norvegicus TaxID=10116 RepID=M0R933_RAT|nr:keratin-associated protein 14 [Rattus norvegicus]EDM10667.1 similar to anagen-specific protein mKAP13 (predicted) [Rattus norvegicus]|eukprot:NP_001102796.1 keratin-associated protein 14 [Rattus norvegicus]
MSCNNSCSGTFSQSFGVQLQNPISSCGSSYPNNVFYSTDLQTPITHQLGSSLHSGCQETFCEPTGCQTSYVVSRPCQRPFYSQGIRGSFSPCQSTFSGSLGLGSRGFQSFGCGYPTPGFGSHGFQSVGCGTRTFSSLNGGSSFFRPTCFSSKSCQSVSYQPTCGTGFF